MTTKGSRLYIYVLVGIITGALIGYLAPTVGEGLKSVSDGFISLIKMLIAPVIFCTVVLGIVGSGHMKKLGRVGVKALLYFEIVSTIALGLGLMMGNVFKPGKLFQVDPSSLQAETVTTFLKKAEEMKFRDYVLHIIPNTLVDAFTGSGDLLQVLLVSILFGIVLTQLGSKGEFVVRFIESLSKVFFGMFSIIMKAAPVGAGAAMAFTIGKFGVESLKPLMGFMMLFYMTCILFLTCILGSLGLFIGFNILRLIRYLREELLTVLGTSSSETILVPLMEKLERLGCSKSVVGMVVPAGYSFNLDGTNIYLTMATLFVSQAMGIDLTWSQQLTILGIAMLTSKGAAGVTGSGFITLAATFSVVPSIPIAGLSLIFGIDRFMSEARALTNCIGNAVATIVVSKWENEVDIKVLRENLKKDPGD